MLRVMAAASMGPVIFPAGTHRAAGIWTVQAELMSALKSGRVLPLALLYSLNTCNRLFLSTQGVSIKIPDFCLKLEAPQLMSGCFRRIFCQAQYLGAICSLHRAGSRIHLFYCLCYCSPPASLWCGCTEQCSAAFQSCDLSSFLLFVCWIFNMCLYFFSV